MKLIYREEQFCRITICSSRNKLLALAEVKIKPKTTIHPNNIPMNSYISIFRRLLEFMLEMYVFKTSVKLM
jgi:hypothetical protein